MIGLLPVRWTPSLVCLGQRLEIHRAKLADGRVSSPRVVEWFSVVEHVGAGLGSGLIDPEDDDGGQGDGGHEGMGASVIAGVDAAPIFEAAEHVLDPVALPVEWTPPITLGCL